MFDFGFDFELESSKKRITPADMLESLRTYALNVLPPYSSASYAEYRLEHNQQLVSLDSIRRHFGSFYNACKEGDLDVGGIKTLNRTDDDLLGFFIKLCRLRSGQGKNAAGISLTDFKEYQGDICSYSHFVRRLGGFAEFKKDFADFAKGKLSQDMLLSKARQRAIDNGTRKTLIDEQFKPFAKAMKSISKTG